MSDSTPKPPTPPTTIHVHLDEAHASGDYINLARIFHSPTEFVIDGMFLPPVSNTAKVVSRLVMSPVHAKQLLRALAQNVQGYEQKFGEIVIPPPGERGPGPGSILH